MSVPTTPSRKAIMPPPPFPPTPRTPSNAMVLHRPSGPITPSTPKTPTRAENALVKVKPDPASSSTQKTPLRIMAPPTPPSTSLIRRTRTITPSPRRRRSSVAPLRSRRSSIMSSPSFLAKLTSSRAKDTPRKGRNAIPGPSSARSRDTSITVEDDEDEDEVEFWRSGQRRGSTVDVAIDVDSDSEDEITPSSPTPTSSATLRGDTPLDLVNTRTFSPFETNGYNDPKLADRAERAESTFSVGSFGSRTTPFNRDPTWDDSDQRYGRYYRKAETVSRENTNSSINPTAAVLPIPLSFIQSISKMGDLIKSIKEKPLDKIKVDDQMIMTDPEKLDIIQDIIFRVEMTEDYKNIISLIKGDLASSEIHLSTKNISLLIKTLKLSFSQSLKSFLNEYKNSNAYKGTKEIRQSMWYNEFKSYLRVSTSMYNKEIDKDTSESILLSLRVICNEKDEMLKIINGINEKFEDINLSQARRILDSIIDVCAQIVNIAWSK